MSGPTDWILRYMKTYLFILFDGSFDNVFCLSVSMLNVCLQMFRVPDGKGDVWTRCKGVRRGLPRHQWGIFHDLATSKLVGQWRLCFEFKHRSEHLKFCNLYCFSQHGTNFPLPKLSRIFLEFFTLRSPFYKLLTTPTWHTLWLFSTFSHLLLPSSYPQLYFPSYFRIHLLTLSLIYSLPSIPIYFAQLLLRRLSLQVWNCSSTLSQFLPQLILRLYSIHHSSIFSFVH